MILFIGGLWCYDNFKNYIENLFNNYKHKEMMFKTCRDVTQADIDNCSIIIAYSFAIQYIYNLDLSDRKIILLSPMLNDHRFKDGIIKLVDKLIDSNSKITTLGVELYLKHIGANNYTLPFWRDDIINWIRDYGIGEKPIANINVKKDWIIIEGFKPISKLPRIDDTATDDNGNKIRHILNFDNHLLFLDKYLV